MWNWRKRGSRQAEDGPETAEVQALLRDLHGDRVEPNPFFVKRVIAAIEAREAEFARGARAWAAVPAFASRVSAVAALLLIMASTFLWTGTHRQPTTVVGLVEDIGANAPAANQDDVFVAPSEDAQ
ncbi:MAG TPA: hypothetical protein VN025_09485 [Candidatus Dormibacteraeota bacterium]|jgi:hypothetical protein|nr:hypothetical protein [Candidatus Dormibacteraeota bacterium]